MDNAVARAKVAPACGDRVVEVERLAAVIIFPHSGQGLPIA
jgi:hypothetical protein